MPGERASAAVNIIPTTTGAAKAVGMVLPELAGRLSKDLNQVRQYQGDPSGVAPENLYTYADA